jgi:hypothetical protein
MEFLYSANRLNVAISRAKCLAIMVASPTLFEVECKAPRQMQLANAFCRTGKSFFANQTGFCKKPNRANEHHMRVLEDRWKVAFDSMT